ncbi:MAG TPA: hypothetical protein VFG20_12070 [Planctomycetaceae bacterium]|jgi:hypothetical protein|nr:hypothetical protein [Planctomycetaceae bacterium]
MTGYTVHTGSNVKFSGGWDRIFSGQKATGKKSGKTEATAKKADKPKSAKKKTSKKKK